VILHLGSGTPQRAFNPRILDAFPAEASVAAAEAWSRRVFHYCPPKEEIERWGIEGIQNQITGEGCIVQIAPRVLTKGMIWKNLWQDVFPSWIPDDFILNPEAEPDVGFFNNMMDPFLLKLEEDEMVPEVVGVWTDFIVHKNVTELEIQGEYKPDSKFLFWVEIRGKKVTDILLKQPWRKRWEYLEKNWGDTQGFVLAKWKHQSESPMSPGEWLFKSGVGLYRCGRNQGQYFTSLSMTTSSGSPKVHSTGSNITGV